MFKADAFLEARILQKKENGTLHSLTTTHNTIDFCSNDYLGFAKSLDLKDRVFRFSRNLESISYLGAGGSRLISGNTALTESLESFVATYHHAEAGLLFNSGYDAMLGLLASIPSRGDTILYDEAIHPAARDGIRLSFAKAYAFAHNNPKDLQKKLSKAKGLVYVVTESVSYRDGDTAPLKELYRISSEAGAHLIVNETHATGVFGNGGKGLIVQNELASKVFAVIHSFAGSLGCHGAIVLGSNLLRSYLINFARPFIFSTALPFHTYITIKSAYDLLNEDEESPEALHHNINLFRSGLTSLALPSGVNYIPADGAIHCFAFSNTQAAQQMIKHLNRNGFDVKLLPRTGLPRGHERLRICLHAFNTPDEIKHLLAALASAPIS